MDEDVASEGVAPPAPAGSSPRPRAPVRAAVAVAALGVVFGDIGTSPLYAVQTVFGPDAPRRVTVDPVAVYGVASLIVWTIVLVVLVKYVLLIMRADNDGEGGIMALVSLIVAERRGGPAPRLLVLLGVGGAALFFGDSLITPAISVLSAVEGLELLDPSLAVIVVPAAVVVIVLLFAFQHRGTSVVGGWFGPVMLIWFLAVGLFGLRGVAEDPAVLGALSPVRAVDFFRADGLAAFLSLGGVVLAVTGAEALYADLGHFGASPIRRAWLLVVFPALVLSYLGQAWLLLHDPAAVANPFFALVPRPLLAPMVLLATAATVIASQAVISGAFSLARQAAHLGYLPSLEIRHTSARNPGQIFVPLVNALLAAGVLGLVLGFGSPARLAAAYGIAVTGTMMITGVLFFTRAYRRARQPRVIIAVVAAGFFAVDLAFLGANLVKVPKGGWLPLLVAACAFTVMANWHAGHERVNRRRRARERPVRDEVEGLACDGRLGRVPGTAVFLSRPGDGSVPALQAIAERIHVLPEVVLLVTVEVREVPHVPIDERELVERLGPEREGVFRVRLRRGFDDRQSVPEGLRQAVARGAIDDAVDLDEATYFVSVTHLRRGGDHGLRGLRERLYLATAKLATDPIRFYGLPSSRTLTVGSSVVLD